MPNTKKCPYCAEEIALEAIKCKHCSEFLTALTANNTREVQKENEYNDETLGIIGLIIPVISLFVPYSSWISLILTAAILSVEASKLGMGSDTDLKPNGKKYESPIVWFFVIFLLWIIAYPWYYFRRTKYGMKNYGIISILIVSLVMIVGIVQSVQGL